MDEPPVVNGRVSSRELYAAISSLREELASAQHAQTADVMAAVAATEHRLSARMERLETTVNHHDDLIQQLRGAKMVDEDIVQRPDARPIRLRPSSRHGGLV